MTVIEKRGDGTWRVRVYHRSRYVASRTFQRRADAVAWERAQKLSLAAGTWVAPAEAGVTLGEWRVTWEATQPERKPSTEYTAAMLWRLHILPKFRRRPVATISHTEVAAWAQGLVAATSASTARAALGYLRRCLGAAVRAGLVARNPTEGVKLPRSRAGEPRPLTHEQVWTLARQMRPRDRVLVLVACYGGLRWGELAALTVGDVSGDGVRVRVRASASATTGKVVLGPTKSHAARTVHLPGVVAAEVLAWTADKHADELLFPSRVGTHLLNSTWRRRVLDPAVERAGIGHRVAPHDFRDTAASLAIASGATVVVVARMLGHQDASTTLRHYAAMFPDDFDRLTANLDAAARTADSGKSASMVT